MKRWLAYPALLYHSGLATRHHLVVWLTMADAKRGIEMVKPQFVDEVIDGKTYGSMLPYRLQKRNRRPLICCQTMTNTLSVLRIVVQLERSCRPRNLPYWSTAAATA